MIPVLAIAATLVLLLVGYAIWHNADPGYTGPWHPAIIAMLLVLADLATVWGAYILWQSKL